MGPLLILSQACSIYGFGYLPNRSVMNWVSRHTWIRKSVGSKNETNGQYWSLAKYSWGGQCHTIHQEPIRIQRCNFSTTLGLHLGLGTDCTDVCLTGGQTRGTSALPSDMVIPTSAMLRGPLLSSDVRDRATRSPASPEPLGLIGSVAAVDARALYCSTTSEKLTCATVPPPAPRDGELPRDGDPRREGGSTGLICSDPCSGNCCRNWSNGLCSTGSGRFERNQLTGLSLWTNRTRLPFFASFSLGGSAGRAGCGLDWYRRALYCGCCSCWLGARGPTAAGCGD
mmetsp:Transcript_89727/g.155357  ORF Transcript_89727/g.155357 Transcript_89727/m.155357 type:complete len:284 (-) Transcript_89727:1951-2802(-)